MEDSYPSWITTKGLNGVILGLHINASSKKTAIQGVYGERLKLSIASPPVDGAANKEIIKFLSKLLGVKKQDVAIIHGKTSKEKMVLIRNSSIDKVYLKVEPLLVYEK